MQIEREKVMRTCALCIMSALNEDVLVDLRMILFLMINILATL